MEKAKRKIEQASFAMPRIKKRTFGFNYGCYTSYFESKADCI